MALELEKEKMMSNKQKEDNKRLMEELVQLQDMYDKTSIELTKTKDLEIKLKDDMERTTYDLEMAQAAGVDAIGVSWGHHSVQRLRKWAPVVDTVAALGERLGV